MSKLAMGKIRTTVGAFGAAVVKPIINVSLGPTFGHHASVRLNTCSNAVTGYTICPKKTVRL
jgi:hypothetical protein